MSEPPATEPSDFVDVERRVQRVMSWVIVSVLTAFGVAALIGLFTVSRTPGSFWQELIRTQFPVVVGLPVAGSAALFITLVLRISTGPIEFEAGPIRFKGGSAPVVFWVLCFMAIALAIHLLWSDPSATATAAPGL